MAEELEQAIDLGDNPVGSPPTGEQSRQMLIALGALGPVEEAKEQAQQAATDSEDSAVRSEAAAVRSESFASDSFGSAESASESQSAASVSAGGAHSSAMDAADSALWSGTARDQSESARDGSVAARNQSVSAAEASISAADESRAARNDARTARDDAQLFKAAAEAAKGSAESAQTGAESAMDLANESASSAATAKSAAELARDGAVTARNQAAGFAYSASDYSETAIVAAGAAQSSAAAASASASAAAAAAAMVDPLRMARSGGVAFDGVTGTALASIDGTILGKIKTVCFAANGSARVAYGGHAAGGWWFYVSGDTGKFTLRLQQQVSLSVYAEFIWDSQIPDGWAHFALVIDGTDIDSPKAELWIDGVSQGPISPAVTGLYSDGASNQLSVGARGNGTVGFTAGAYRNIQVFAGGLISSQIAALAGSGGSIVPTALRSSLLGDIPMDDGCDYQLRDQSGLGTHGIASLTGCSHLIPKDSGSVAHAAANATTAMYLRRNGNVLPVNAIVTGVIVDGDYRPASARQTVSLRRIRLAPSGANLIVQRSNGTTHEPLETFTPASLASVNVTILFRIV